MSLPALDLCRSCNATLKATVAALAKPDHHDLQVSSAQVSEQLDRFSLWMGNIGALHRPGSPMSLESRLHEACDVLNHVLELLDDLNEASNELLQIVSGAREAMVAAVSYDDGDSSKDDVEQSNGEELHEENELLQDITGCVTQLFRVSSLIRRAERADRFAKALGRDRYRFNDQFDIAHVGEKFPKLATEGFTWLRTRLGRAITHRRHYLNYIQDHRQYLGGSLDQQAPGTPQDLEHYDSREQQSHSGTVRLESSSRPSTFFTKASSIAPDRISPQMLTAGEISDSEDDAKSYTTIARSADGDLHSATLLRIPKLEELKTHSRKEFECPFCFRMKRFKNERTWRRHVFADLRPYVCTFRECDSPYFGDINKWFQHEMQNHRVSYTCQLCRSNKVYTKQRFLAHMQRNHSDILEDGGEHIVLETSRRPLDQIPAQNCPCCSDWADRLKNRAVESGISTGTPENILTVSPVDFKRHLASHLEQLALFAVPIGSPVEDDANSNMAVGVDERSQSNGSQLRTLSFDSSRPPSSVYTSRVLELVRPSTPPGVELHSSQNFRDDPLGLTVLYSPESRDRTVDILFMHGLGGSSFRTWCKDGNLETFWPREWLPKESVLSTARILTFGYNTEFAVMEQPASLHIDQFATSLLFHMKHKGDEHGKMGQVPIIIVAHSIGGLVFKDAFIRSQLNEQHSEVISNIKAVLFLATPHRAIDTTKSSLSRILASSDLGRSSAKPRQGLTEGSIIVDQINNAFYQHAAKLEIYSFYESLPTRLGLYLAKRMVLEKESCMMNYPNEVSVPLMATHNDMARFSGPDDPNYKLVRNVLHNIVSTLKASKANDSEDDIPSETITDT